MFAVSGFEGILRKIDDKYTNFVVISGIFLLALMPLRHTLLHSNTIGTYYNELSGGISSVFGKYQIDGEEAANKMACEWVLAHCGADNDSTKVRVMTDGGRGCDVFFQKDTAAFTLQHGQFYERENETWDYFISFPDKIPAKKLLNKNWEATPTIQRYFVENKPVVIVVRNENSPLFAPPVLPSDSISIDSTQNTSTPLKSTK